MSTLSDNNDITSVEEFLHLYPEWIETINVSQFAFSGQVARDDNNTDVTFVLTADAKGFFETLLNTLVEQFFQDPEEDLYGLFEDVYQSLFIREMLFPDNSVKQITKNCKFYDLFDLFFQQLEFEEWIEELQDGMVTIATCLGDVPDVVQRLIFDLRVDSL